MTCILSTLIGPDTAEVLGNYTHYNTAVEDAKTALQEVVPDATVSVKPSKGKVKDFALNATQEIRAVGTEYKVILEVVAPEITAPEDHVPGPDEVVSITETPEVPETPDVHQPEPPESLIEVLPEPKAKTKKTKAQKYPDPIWAGEFRFWGCDQHTVKSFIDNHPEEAKTHGIELRKRGSKFALVCDKQTVWSCSYESVANLALEMAQSWVAAA
jgi:hypothetical protein